MANFAITDPQILDSLNYILSGPIPTANQFKVKNFQTFKYCTGDRVAPYMTDGTVNPSPPPDYLPPSPPPPENQYIETDCYNIVNITDPTQKAVISCQVRPFFEATCTQIDSEIKIYVAVNRYKEPNILYYPTTVAEYAFTYTSSVPLIDQDLGRLLFLNVTDEPGALGVYYYWLEFYVETVVSGVHLPGDFVLDWIGAEFRSISTNVYVNAPQVEINV